MKKHTDIEQTKREREQRLIERLRNSPELLERFETILGISEADGEKLPRADDIEERLINEIRQLGNEVMGKWAANAEARVGEELQQKTPGAGVRKKKS